VFYKRIFFLFIIFIILYCFDTLILKITFKNKKYYFNIFSSKNILKNNHYHSIKHFRLIRMVIIAIDSIFFYNLLEFLK